MAAVLGISALYHDAAAALVIDGQIAAAMQEERFSRIKNDPSLPIRAARACLAEAGLRAEDLDEVSYYEDPYAKLERVLLGTLRSWPRALRQFPRALRSQLGGKLWVKDALAASLGVPRDRVTHRDHHRSHAASAFLPSPFARAAVLTVDAVGEALTTGVWLGDGGELTLLDQVSYPHSLGLLYAAVTAWLGFEVNEGESKVMGLAAFGRPTRSFEPLIRIGRGTFELVLDAFDHHTEPERAFGPSLEAVLGPPRPVGRPWEFPQDQGYADVAASLQATLETALLSLARHARARTGATALCLAGGVALNAVANARLARDAGFAELFVQPAAGDAGGALGAALLSAVERGDPRPSLPSAALGTSVRGSAAATLAEHLGLAVERTGDPADAVAARLLRGEVVGVCHGRFEWGPRALGQRSLLALPAPVAVRERLNRVVKRREPFRPFAPAVAGSEAGAWFGPYAALPARFMTTVAEVLPERREALAAVTHVDGTARLQVVDEDTLLGQIVARIARATGTPAVLNTSLNGRGEPIVATEPDALGFLLAHPADALLVDDAVVTRRS